MAVCDVAAESRLERLGRLRQRALRRDDYQRFWALDTAHGLEVERVNAPVIRKCMQTGRSAGSFSPDGRLTAANVVWGRPTRMAARVAIGTRSATAFRPLRIRHANRQPRSRSVKRSPRVAGTGNRGDPHLAGDDDPPLALASDFRPSRGATAVARAFELAVSRAA
jgi:hypothetical protein